MIRASLRRDGDELIVSTNSLERFTRSRETLGGIGFTLIDVQDSLDLDQIRSGSGAEAEAEPQDMSGSALPPDVADAIQDQMEDRWLADHIPLFGGMTPREALADPTRRADVLQLLKELEARPVARLPPYNMTRMRQKLGLMTMG